MTTEKYLTVIQLYRKNLESLVIPKSEAPPEYTCDSKRVAIMHCHVMLNKMEYFLKKGDMEKAVYWLGFVQGILWSQGRFTLDELNHLRLKAKELALA